VLREQRNGRARVQGEALAHAVLDPAKTVTVCAIVRDEEAVIARMIRCAHDVLGARLAGVILADTGSVDATIATARRAAHELAVPIVVRHHKWQNFAANRNMLLELARRLAKGFLLLLDADMTLEGEVGPLDGRGYMVEFSQGDDLVSTWQPYLIHRDTPCRYIGKIHGALEIDGLPKLVGAKLVHRPEPGRAGRRLNLAREMLEQEVAENPEDARSVFYLAETYRDLGMDAEAVPMYARRAEMTTGWPEEAYISRMEAARLSNDLEGMMRAFESHPRRGEALYHLLGMLRARGMRRIAWELARYGTQLRELDDEVWLFPQPWIYRWGLPFEYAIAAWWAGEYEQHDEISRRLLEMSLPDNVREQIERNLAAPRPATMAPGRSGAVADELETLSR
jgi:glycosyltransferase involved in cell wall biosynthesis